MTRTVCRRIPFVILPSRSFLKQAQQSRKHNTMPDTLHPKQRAFMRTTSTNAKTIPNNGFMIIYSALKPTLHKWRLIVSPEWMRRSRHKHCRFCKQWQDNERKVKNTHDKQTSRRQTTKSNHDSRRRIARQGRVHRSRNSRNHGIARADDSSTVA